MRRLTFNLLLIASVSAGCQRETTTPAATAPATESVPASSADHHLATDTPKPSVAATQATGTTGVATARPPADAAVPPAARARTYPAVERVRDREVTVPVGTALSVALTSGVSSNGSSVEDAVSGTLQRAVVVDGVTVVPAGAAVGGYVTEATESGRVKGLARVAFRLTSLSAGEMRYTIRTSAVAREARSTKKEDALKIGVGAGAGAVVGAIAGGKKGAAIGSAVGGGGGTGVVLATRGEEVSFPDGTVVTARLTEALTVRVPIR